MQEEEHRTTKMEDQKGNSGSWTNEDKNIYLVCALALLQQHPVITEGDDAALIMSFQ